MCWNKEASLVFAVLSSVAAVAMVAQQAPAPMLLLTGVYSGMEWLQYLQYRVIDRCGDQWNATLTKVAWAYIWVQPIVFNVYAYLLTTRNKTVFAYNIVLSAVVFVIAMDSVITHWFHRAKQRAGDQVMGGDANCSVTGATHLRWVFDIRRNGLSDMSYAVYFLCIALPLLWLRPWHNALLTLLGWGGSFAAAAWWTRGHVDELASFWCLLSGPTLIMNYLMYIARLY